MFLIQTLFRFVGVLLIIVLIFLNTNVGKTYIIDNNIPLQNKIIRANLSLDWDPELVQTGEQLNDQRPIYGVFDLPAMFFIGFLLIAYMLLSFDINEFAFFLRSLFRSTFISRESLNLLVSNLKNLSEGYYSGGAESLRSVMGGRKVPKVYTMVVRHLEMRIPFEDIMNIMGNDAALTRKGYDSGIKIVSSLSNISPTFGVMGTVLGLMGVLGNLSDPTTLGPSMALALLTTLYGLLLSVIIFKPFLIHLETMKVIEMNGYQMVNYWVRNLSNNKPSFYLDQTVNKS